jgi:hypothetical protein
MYHHKYIIINSLMCLINRLYLLHIDFSEKVQTFIIIFKILTLQLL